MALKSNIHRVSKKSQKGDLLPFKWSKSNILYSRKHAYVTIPLTVCIHIKFQGITTFFYDFHVSK